MEVTLDKIELVRDRTGVSYKEAKDALEAADGSVVDAIIAIEESIDSTVTSGMTGITRDAAAKKDELVEKMKEVAKKGGVSKIRVTRDGDTIVNIPLVAGVLGALVAPWGIIAATAAAFGFKCKIEFVKDDGSIIDISEKAGDVYENAKERGTGLYTDLRDRAPGNLDEFKTRAQETFNDIKDRAPSSFEELKDRTPDKFDEFKNKFDELWEKGESAVNKAKETVSKPMRSFKEGVQDLNEDFNSGNLGEEIAEEIDHATEDVNMEMSQLEKDLVEMQQAAEEGIENIVEEIKDEVKGE